ncbi:PREDICTED: serine protease persephone-like isoform X2 [Papilio polytes]|uniref:serine protease persephone-like isoform X2 n=1 Tax=Papilio polytes TaxID=76194 RepID=UPI000675CCFD|nr:PREDICTED: serine protease persephone-like isoform X2 [Papilio polytes]
MWFHGLICLCLFFKLHYADEVGDKCIVNNQEATCMLISNCVAALRDVRNTERHLLPRCGFKNDAEIVCCPPEPAPEKIPYVLSSRLGVKTLRPADKACKKITETYDPPSAIYIIGGTSAEQGEFPHMVALGYLISSRDEYSFLCGGSLITTQYVLTAVHCVHTTERIEPTMVRVGVLNITGSKWNDETDYEIDIIHVHPNYKRSRKYHDLALIRLISPIRTSRNAFPACLYTSAVEPTTSLYITGWGKTDVTRAGTSNILLKAMIQIVSREYCNTLYTTTRKLPKGIMDGQICAGDSKGVTDSCQGDSGGPLQGLTDTDGHYRIVGVTSFGSGCGSAVPGVYTRIYKYLHWIESLVWPSDLARITSTL